MICKKCGTEIPNDVRFCISCGAPVNDAPNAGPQIPQQQVPPQAYAVPPVAATVKAKKGLSIIPNILGMIGGALSIFAAVQVKLLDVGSWEAAEYYGGDAYTGIQQASAQTANNVLEGMRMLQTGLSGFLLAFGLATIAYFWVKMKENKL